MERPFPLPGALARDPAVRAWLDARPGAMRHVKLAPERPADDAALARLIAQSYADARAAGAFARRRSKD